MNYCCSMMEEQVESHRFGWMGNLAVMGTIDLNYCPFCGVQYPIEEQEPQKPSGEWAVRELKAGRMVKMKRDTEWPVVCRFKHAPYRYKDGTLQFYVSGTNRWQPSAWKLDKIEDYDIWEPAEDPQSGPETVDRKIDWRCDFPMVHLPTSRSEPAIRIDSGLYHKSCIGYVVEGLEDLPDQGLPQIPVVWVRMEHSWDRPAYLYHPPCQSEKKYFERRRAHAMRFKIQE